MRSLVIMCFFLVGCGYSTKDSHDDTMIPPTCLGDCKPKVTVPDIDIDIDIDICSKCEIDECPSDCPQPEPMPEPCPEPIPEPLPCPEPEPCPPCPDQGNCNCNQNNNCVIINN